MSAASGYTGICRGCETRQRLRLKSGAVGSHKEPRYLAAPGERRWCPGIGQLPRGGTERCAGCRAEVGKGRSHKMDCHTPRFVGRKDTR